MSTTHEECQRINDLEESSRRSQLDALTKSSVDQTVLAILEQCDLIRDTVESGDLVVVGAIYDLDSGNVEFLTSGLQQEVA